MQYDTAAFSFPFSIVYTRSALCSLHDDGCKVVFLRSFVFTGHTLTDRISSAGVTNSRPRGQIWARLPSHPVLMLEERLHIFLK